MAMIPTMTARTPSRISEVDDDLSTDAGLGVCVDVDMKGVPFVWPGAGRGFCHSGAENGHWRSCASQYSWAGPRAEGCERISGQPVAQAWPQMCALLVVKSGLQYDKVLAIDEIDQAVFFADPPGPGGVLR